MAKKVAYMYGHPNKSIPSPILYSAVKAYQDYKGAFKAGKEMVKETQRHRDYVVKRLNEIEGIECQTPKGALYAFPKIRDVGTKWSNDLEFLLDLLEEEGVTWHMGRRFGKCGFGHMRVLLQPKLEKLEEGLSRLERFMTKRA
jgi:aspartate/methionine/tyrosine aminotransferase